MMCVYIPLDQAVALELLVLVMACLAKFATSACFLVGLFYTPEVFPTRSTSVRYVIDTFPLKTPKAFWMLKMCHGNRH